MYSFSATTATGLAKVIDNKYSHDQITRFLEQPQLDQKDYWKKIKPVVREIETDNSVLAVDDFIEEKPHTTVNSLVCYHFDHNKRRSIKGVNIINFLLTSDIESNDTISIPVSYEPVFKTIKYIDSDGKEKRKSPIKKNEMVRRRLKILVFQNQVKFKYITWDTWFSSADNMKFVVSELKRHFVSALKDNRLVALTIQDKLSGNWKQVSSLDIKPGQVYQAWIKGIPFPVILARQIFTNKDGSTGVLYLASDDSTLTFEQITTIYKKRWKVEESHKSLKQNASLEKSPTKMEKSQMNHIFAAFIAFVKLERLKVKNRLNHFALKSKIYITALKNASLELQRLKENQGPEHFQMKMEFQ